MIVNFERNGLIAKRLHILRISAFLVLISYSGGNCLDRILSIEAFLVPKRFRQVILCLILVVVMAFLRNVFLPKNAHMLMRLTSIERRFKPLENIMMPQMLHIIYWM